MRLNVKPAASLHGKHLSRLWNMRVGVSVVLAVALSVALLAARGWNQSTSAQELTGATESVNAEAELSLMNILPGDLDITFGVDGIVATDLGHNLDDSAYAVAIQSDNKVVAVGSVSTSTTGKDFAVIRLNSNGGLDTTFSDDGKLTFNFNSATREDIARAVAIQPDGKIVVAGEADVLGFGNYDIVLARLNADGTFDTSFGSNGKVTTNLANNRADYGRSLVLQPDGKILVAGYSNRPTTGDDFVAVRYNSNGSLDTTFDGDGIVTTDILTNREDRATSAALQFDGRIILAGYTNDPSFKNNFALVRYNANGSLDSSFNGTGKVTTDLNLNSDDIGNAVTLQSNDKIIVAGQSSGDVGLVRYNSNGALDVLFGGGDGIVTTNFGSGAADTARGVVVQAGGKIIVAGKSRTELALARYNSDGALDNSFDKDGLLVQNVGNNQLSSFGGYWGITLQSDGKLVAVGDGWRDFSGNDFAVSRLNPNGTFDFSFGGGDGIVSTDINVRVDEASGVAIQSDGRIVVVGGAQNSTGGYDFAVARYNADGTLDTSFDNDGIVITDIQGHPDEGGFAVVIQPDGKIVVAGQSNNVLEGLLSDGVVIRYNTNGTLDTTFGTNGIAILPARTQLNPDNVRIRIRDMKLQSDGKIVVAGQAQYFSIYADGLVARFSSSGVLETRVVIDFNDVDYIDTVALQSDGKIVIAGYTNDRPAGDLALARLNTNLTLDTSFDGDGKLTTDFGNSSFDAALDLVIQPDGKIIAVGQTDINFIDFAVARYNANGSLDQTFGGGDGKLNIDFNAWGDVCAAVSLQPDGKIVLAGVGDLDRNFSGFAVVKLTPTGAFDTGFGGGTGRVVTTLGEGVNTGLGQALTDMALQPDGKIVVVGSSNFNSTERDFVAIRYENVGQTCAYELNPTGASFPAAAGNSSINVITSAGCSWTATSGALWITLISGISGSGSGTVNFSLAANAGVERVGTVTVAGQTFTVTQEGSISAVPTLQFSQATYSFGENSREATVTVTRAGNSTSAVSVDYRTQDADTFTVGCADTVNNQGAAYARCDFATVVGALNFAVGETVKAIKVSIIDDSHAEIPETFQVRLSNPVGATLGTPNVITVTLQDNDLTGAANPIFTTPFFVRLHYLDFLSREAEPGEPWSAVLNNCPNAFNLDSQSPSAGCDRIIVSQSFFGSPEFRLKGFFVYNFYKVALNRRPEYAEIIPDMSSVTGTTPAETFAKRAAFSTSFTERQDFRTLYNGLSNTQYVNALLDRYGLQQITTPDPQQPEGGTRVVLTRADMLTRLGASGAQALTRAQVLRAIVESNEVTTVEYNGAFVAMQYYGYLRRTPEESGYQAWLRVLNQDPNNIRIMVNGFMNSSEYRLRFGQP